MARINTNVPSLMAQSDLKKANQSLQSALQRLSSGLRINRGADDPAGLIASETLRSELQGVRQGVENSQRAASVIATAEGALNEVAALLTNIKALTVQAANTGGMSPAEIEANQLQINSAVQSITRIANVTNFAGLNLLDGSLDYNVSGIIDTELTEVRVFNAQFGTAPNIGVEVDVTVSAQPATLLYPMSMISGAVTLEIAGVHGVETLQFVSGTTSDVLMEAINQVKEATGVSAAYANGSTVSNGLLLYSTEWGSDAFVSVDRLNGGDFETKDATDTNVIKRAEGRDVAGTINGAYTVGKGLRLSLNTTYLTLDVEVDESFGAGTSEFTVTGGGALFQLGPHVSINEQRSFGIQSIVASRLGDAEYGYLSQIVTGGEYSLVAGEAGQAAKIIDRAIGQVAALRGRMGAFEKNTLMTNINSLEVALENIQSSESSIRDADFAAETANLTRGQILSNAATSVLAIANSTPQSVLSLLQ
ncbi:MAG: flagellin [Planctomycetes bacterium]|nr:flagellin [Planctomycetota bacterium]